MEPVDRISNLIPNDAELVVWSVVYPDPSDDDYYCGHGADYSKYDHLDKQKIIDIISDVFRASKRMYDFEEPESFNDLKSIVKYYYEGDGDYCSAAVYTKKEFLKKKEEEDFAYCSKVAAEICRKYNVKPNTLDFVHALVSHYKDIADSEDDYRNNPEVRMERYAGYDDKDNFYLDNDYSSSIESKALEDLDRTIEWLHRNCPLLMAKYEEWRLANADRSDEESESETD